MVHTVSLAAITANTLKSVKTLSPCAMIVKKHFVINVPSVLNLPIIVRIIIRLHAQNFPNLHMFVTDAKKETLAITVNGITVQNMLKKHMKRHCQVQDLALT